LQLVLYLSFHILIGKVLRLAIKKVSCYEEVNAWHERAVYIDAQYSVLYREQASAAVKLLDH